MKPILMLVALCALAGCDPLAGTPLDPATVSQKSTADICHMILYARIGHGQPSDMTIGIAELSRRKAFPPREVQAISAMHVYVGMSEAAAVCAFGSNPEDVNITTTAYGSDTQYVFGGGLYLYTANGRVTAIQS